MEPNQRGGGGGGGGGIRTVERVLGEGHITERTCLNSGFE